MTRKGFATYAKKFESDIDPDSRYFWEDSDAASFAFDLAYAIWAWCSIHNGGEFSVTNSWLSELYGEPIRFRPGMGMTESEIANGPAEGEEGTYEYWTAHDIYTSFTDLFYVNEALVALRWFCSGPYAIGSHAEWVPGKWHLATNGGTSIIIDDKQRNVALLCNEDTWIDEDVSATGHLITNAKRLYAAVQKLLFDLSQGEVIKGNPGEDEGEHDDVVLLENAIALCDGKLNVPTADLDKLVQNIEERL